MEKEITVTKPLGIVWKGNQVSLLPKIELWLDLQCSECKTCWQKVHPIINKIKEKPLVIIHLTPAPNHFNSFLATESAHIILNRKGKEEFWEFINLAFENQKKFQNDQTVDLTRNQVMEIFCEMAVKLGVERNLFLEDLKNHKYLKAAENDFKYNVNRGVARASKTLHFSKQVPSTCGVSSVLGQVSVSVENSAG